MKSYPPRALKDEKLEKLIWFLPGLASTLLVIFIGILYIAPFAFISAALFKMHGWIALLVPVLGVAIAVTVGLCIIARYRSKSHRLIKKACKKAGYHLKVRHNLLTILLRQLQVTFNRTHATMQNTLRFLTKPMFPIPVKKKLKFDTDGIFVRPDQKLIKVMLFCPTPVRVYGFKEKDEAGGGAPTEEYNPDVTGMTMVVQASKFGNKMRMATLKPLETDFNEFEMDNGMQDVWGTFTFGGFAFARYLERLDFERRVNKERAHRQSKDAWEKYRHG